MAWAHLCAKNKLSTDPKKIGGHEIFVTDETPVLDTLRFCQRVSLELENIKLKPSTWYIPSLIAYFLAFLLELLVNLVNYVYRFQLDISPRALVSYGSSVILFDRLRACMYYIKHILSYILTYSFSSSHTFGLRTNLYQQ